jgi:biofilm protein TabA
MILDHLNNASTYESLHPRFRSAFTYLRETDFSTLEQGRHDIDGSNLFALVQTYSTKPESEGRWESHRTHIDIQYLIAGRERIGLAPLHTMTESQPYNPDKDLLFHTGPGHSFTLHAQHFAIFFPHDVHMPSLHDNSPSQVSKVVLKVRV